MWCPDHKPTTHSDADATPGGSNELTTTLTLLPSGLRASRASADFTIFRKRRTSRNAHISSQPQWNIARRQLQWSKATRWRPDRSGLCQQHVLGHRCRVQTLSTGLHPVRLVRFSQFSHLGGRCSKARRTVCLRLITDGYGQQHLVPIAIPFVPGIGCNRFSVNTAMGRGIVTVFDVHLPGLVGGTRHYGTSSQRRQLSVLLHT